MKPLWRSRRGEFRGETFERGGWGCRLRGCAHHVFAGRSVTSEADGDGSSSSSLMTGVLHELSATALAINACVQPRTCILQTQPPRKRRRMRVRQCHVIFAITCALAGDVASPWLAAAAKPIAARRS